MNFIPARGDIVWLDFDPQSGHEQAGRRPALVVSHFAYNKKVGLAIFCPITNQEKGFPFEVRLPGDIKAKGVVLADKVKSLDWQKRKAEFYCTAPEDVLEEVSAKIKTLIF